MLSYIYQLVQSLQTIIVGVIGFSGVIITLITNARMSRKQHERTISHERKSLRIALYAELELAKTTFISSSVTSDNGNEDAAFFPNEYPQPVYRSHITKIGLLSPVEISAIIEAYTLINELPIRLSLLSFGHDPSFDHPGYIYISAAHAETAMDMYRSFLPKIEHALETLKKQQ